MEGKDVLTIIALMLGPVIVAVFTLWCAVHQLPMPAVLESNWNRIAGQHFCPDRKSIGCSSGDHLGNHLTPFNWNNLL